MVVKGKHPPSSLSLNTTCTVMWYHAMLRYSRQNSATIQIPWLKTHHIHYQILKSCFKPHMAVNLQPEADVFLPVFSFFTKAVIKYIIIYCIKKCRYFRNNHLSLIFWIAKGSYLAHFSPVLWYMQRRCSFILTGSPRGPTGPITPLGPGSPGSPCKGRDTENEPETEIVEDNAKASNKQWTIS